MTGISGIVLSVLRIVAALLLIEHGLTKLIGWPMAQAWPPDVPVYFKYAAIVLEVGGGAILAVGLLTRIVAFILSGQMAVAYFMVHEPISFFPVVNQGEPAILFCFIFLYVAAAGGGSISLDALRTRRSRRS